MKTRRKPVRAKFSVVARPAPPRPGHWKVMQRHGPDVLQYAWTCPECRVTEYVLVDPPRPMDGDRRERCTSPACSGLAPTLRVPVVVRREAS